jgi:hypothetical protein
MQPRQKQTYMYSHTLLRYKFTTTQSVPVNNTEIPLLWQLCSVWVRFRVICQVGMINIMITEIKFRSRKKQRIFIVDNGRTNALNKYYSGKMMTVNWSTIDVCIL